MTKWHPDTNAPQEDSEEEVTEVEVVVDGEDHVEVVALLVTEMEAPDSGKLSNGHNVEIYS